MRCWRKDTYCYLCVRSCHLSACYGTNKRAIIWRCSYTHERATLLTSHFSSSILHLDDIKHEQRAVTMRATTPLVTTPISSFQTGNNTTNTIYATMNINYQQQHHPVIGSIISYVANETAFQPEEYVPTANVEQQHHSFRFGHANDLEALIVEPRGSNDVTTDYILGVTSASMVILGIAVLWLTVIMSFKCAGKKRVGFLAGRLECPKLQLSLNPIAECLAEDDENFSTQTPIGHHHNASSGPENFSVSETERDHKFNRKALMVRVVFVISGICVMIAGVLFYSLGVTAFQNSLNDVQNSLFIVENTAFESMNLTKSVLNTKHDLVSALNETMSDTDAGLCQGPSQLSNGIREAEKLLVSDMNEMSLAVDESLKSFSADLLTVANTARGMSNDLETAKGFFYALIAISIAIDVLICIMLTVTVFSAKDISNYFTKCVTCALIWPIFVLFLALSWIFATVFLIFSLAGSDFCYKPDEIVLAFLNKNKDKFDSAIFAILIFYVSGCAVVPQAMNDIAKLVTMVKTMLAHANDLADKVASESVDDLATDCGLDKAGAIALQKGVQMISGLMQELEKLLSSFKGIVSCQNINPIYTSLVYDATCTEAVDGFTWLYGSCFAICVCAMTMITFRAALYPVKRPELDSGLSTPLLSS